MQPTQFLVYAQRLQALAQAGLTFTASEYDRERYREIREISVGLLEGLTDEPHEKIVRVFASETGYQTPKVDIRAVVIGQGGKILMVSETSDGGRWTLPGGWADVGYTPFEVAAKEVREEAGLSVTPMRLLALLDKKVHPHPPQPWYIYKAFIQCAVEGGTLLQETNETRGARWFSMEEVASLDLSVDRITLSQMRTMYALACDPESAVLCD